MYDLTFHPLSHTYTLNGATVPGITEILDAVGLISKFMPDAAKQRGGYVHEAIELHLKGELHPESEEQYRGWLDAVDACIAENGLNIMEIEEPVACLEYGYATCIDAISDMNHKDRLAVINWKTSDPLPWYSLQAAGEFLASAGHFDKHSLTKPHDVYQVYISEEGTYDMVKVDVLEVSDSWESVLHVYDWIQRHTSTSVRPRSRTNTDEQIVIPDNEAVIFNTGERDDREHSNTGDEVSRGLFD